MRIPWHPTAAAVLLLGLSAAIVTAGEADPNPWVAVAGDQPYAVVATGQIPELAGFPLQSRHYRLDPEAVAFGVDYHFVVHGERGQFFVTGVPEVRKYCFELDVVGRYGGTDEGKQIIRGAGDAFGKIGRGIGEAVFHPGVAVKSFFNSVVDTGESIGRTVTGDDDPGRSADGRKRSDLGGGPAGGQRRAFAAELGVDVYTDNPELRALLNEVGRLRKAGGFSTAVVPYHIDLAARFNPNAPDASTESFITQNEPAVVREEIGKLMRQHLGLDPKAAPLRGWLDNPNYTPRQIAYVGKALVVLGTRDGMDGVVNLLSRAGNPRVADIFARQAEALAWIGTGLDGGFAQIVPMPLGFAGADRAGQIHVVLAFDTLRPWPQSADAFARLVAALLGTAAPAKAIYVTGDVASEFVEMGRKDGILVQPLLFRQ